MPQPIDMQTEMGRMAMAERIQDAASRATLAAAHRSMMEEDQERREQEAKVDETPETQSEHVDEDGRRKNPFAGRRGKRVADADQSEAETRSKRKTAPPPDGEHHFDVSV